MLLYYSNLWKPEETSFVILQHLFEVVRVKMARTTMKATDAN